MLKQLTQEELSVLAVMRYERSQGRKPIDVSKRHIGYDVASSGRYIEVKSKPKGLPPYTALYSGLLKKLGSKVARYYIYIVWDYATDPKLTILTPDLVFSNIEIFSQYRIQRKAYSRVESIKLKKI